MVKSEITYLCSQTTKKGSRCQREATFQFLGKGLCQKHYYSALEDRRKHQEADKIYQCHGIVSEEPKVLCAERHRCKRYPVPKGIKTTQLQPKIENGVCRNYLSLVVK